ncbi:purine phosphorylase, family 2 [Thermosinus carboxydivorans Nor1]|uniref:Purine phosphorylase, family 2 n=1 Tax=Thermosinus carboxydivorans Nor1 TaxID=401526 RepID=A1HSV5_9FIRM|nr:MTAP family purine nucleoside phosphorylase [Thermosinus carboxydivorans]EAX46899.1 purine phosphorylase, family 2 [Thermosinus carboxydivorans Nor1]
MNLLQTDFAVIGGSGTLSSDFPLGAGDPGVKILADDLFFDTPYGMSPPFRLFSVDDRQVLTCKMHGWRSGTSRADASRQVFWVLRETGVKRIIAEGGVGSVNHLLDPRDVVVPDDYIDLSLRKDVGLEGKYLLVMRDALCPEIRSALVAAARERYGGRIFTRGVYAVTEGRHFESPAEIRMLRGHADIVGQSLCPEVYLAREIGACYAGLYFVVNYGEGVVTDWSHQELKAIFYNDAPLISRILLDAIRRLAPAGACQCRDLRKETLLKGVYSPADNMI